MLGELTDAGTDMKTHHDTAGKFPVARYWKMSSFAETRVSDIVLLFLVGYVLLKMKESWVGAVVLHVYQQETKNRKQLNKTLRDGGSSIMAAREDQHANTSVTTP